MIGTTAWRIHDEEKSVDVLVYWWYTDIVITEHTQLNAQCFQKDLEFYFIFKQLQNNVTISSLQTLNETIRIGSH